MLAEVDKYYKDSQTNENYATLDFQTLNQKELDRRDDRGACVTDGEKEKIRDGPWTQREREE